MNLRLRGLLAWSERSLVHIVFRAQNDAAIGQEAERQRFLGAWGPLESRRTLESSRPSSPATGVRRERGATATSMRQKTGQRSRQTAELAVGRPSMEGKTRHRMR